jgi:glutamyl-tRNA reductase
MLSEDLQAIEGTVENESLSTLQSLSVLGVSYKTAGLEIRSLLSFSGEKLTRLLERLTAEGVSQCLVLSTCNRTEIYFAGSYPEVPFRILCEVAGVEADELSEHCYLSHGEDTARHAFRVASGLESAALGETEILAQLREALQVASEGGHISGALNLMFRRALNVSKRVRTETDICRNVTSVSSMAIRQASLAANGLRDKKILLLGAGAIAERLAKELSRVHGVNCTVANRTASKAEALAVRYEFAYSSLDDLRNLLSSHEVIFCAIGSDEPILMREILEGLTLTIVDLGVPSVVVPLPHGSSTKLIDMEFLATACVANSELRKSAISGADQIIDAEVAEFVRACSERDVAPAITALVSLGEHVRRANLNWAMSELGDVAPEQRKVVEDLAFRMMRGMLQGQIAAMKSDSLSLQEKACLASVFRDICPEEGRD